MTALPRAELLQMRRRISMIFQGFNLLEQRSVLRNVTFPLEISGVGRKAAQAKAKELLQVVGLEDKADAYPAQLSGGQKQRVAIARALATDPRYLLCDEATSALDPNTTRSILELLRRINRELGVTIVVITHEMKVIDQICDRVAVIDQSRIAEMGRVADVFTSPRSEIARELILPQDRAAIDTSGGKKLRLIFDGEYSQEPVISKMTLDCQAPVNIIFADTKEFEGTIYGHMIVELPNDENQASKILAWLKNSPVKWKEED
jgi:D-methionine transport system ATP-binding protein